MKFRTSAKNYFDQSVLISTDHRKADFKISTAKKSKIEAKMNMFNVKSIYKFQVKHECGVMAVGFCCLNIASIILISLA